jgi:hypothetical protein
MPVSSERVRNTGGQQGAFAFLGPDAALSDAKQEAEVAACGISHTIVRAGALPAGPVLHCPALLCSISAAEGNAKPRLDLHAVVNQSLPELFPNTQANWSTHLETRSCALVLPAALATAPAAQMAVSGEGCTELH